MKQICAPDELRKAILAAGLGAAIADISGESQKQLDGTFLPVCEPIFSLNATPADIDAVNVVFTQQAARDWRTILNAESTRIQAIDTTISQDAIIAQIKAMTNAEYDAWWAANVTNAAQAIGVLKRVVRIICRRLL